LDGTYKGFLNISNTENYGIKFSREKLLRVFADTDYAGDIHTRKSTTGFLFMIGNSPTSRQKGGVYF